MVNFNIHNKLKIKSEVPLDYLPSYFKTGKIKNPDLIIEKKKKISHEVGVDAIWPPYIFSGKKLLLHKYGFMLPFEMSIQNLEGRTKISVTPFYYKVVENSKQVIRYVVDLKLLRRGLMKTHGSCVQFEGNGIMAVGWDCSGKSSIAMTFVKAGAGFLSGDITYLDKNYAYAYPKKLKVFKGLGPLSEKLNNIPYVNRYLGIYEEISPEKIVNKTKVKYIFVSRFGEKNIRKLSYNEMVETMILLNDYMMGKSFDNRNLILAYSYYNKYDLAGLLKSRYEILKKFLKRKQCFEVSAKKVSHSIEMIKKTIE